MVETTESILDALGPVFLELGKAVYICQTFESSLCLLLAQMAHEGSEGEDGAFQAAWDFHSKKPLGRLLKSLAAQIEVPKDLEAYLSSGIDKRNEIVHTYLTKNAKRLYDTKGRLEVEKELSELKLEVKRRDVVINKLIDVLFKKYGVSNESLKRDADKLWEYLNPKQPPGPSAH